MWYDCYVRIKAMRNHLPVRANSKLVNACLFSVSPSLFSNGIQGFKSSKFSSHHKSLRPHELWKQMLHISIDLKKTIAFQPGDIKVKKGCYKICKFKNIMREWRWIFSAMWEHLKRLSLESHKRHFFRTYKRYFHFTEWVVKLWNLKLWKWSVMRI